MNSPVANVTCYEEVVLVTKGTFIEFRWPEDDNIPKLRRNSSAPSLLGASVSSFAEEDAFKLMEAATPTTCASVNGDDDDIVSFPDELEEDKIINFARWADVSDIDSSMSLMSESLESAAVDEMPKQRNKDGKQKRRSGRARQRESARKRMRTPSPARKQDSL